VIGLTLASRHDAGRCTAGGRWFSQAAHFTDDSIQPGCRCSQQLGQIFVWQDCCENGHRVYTSADIMNGFV